MAPDSSTGPASQKKRFLYTNTSALVLGGLVLMWLSRDARLDFAIANIFFDPARGGFHLRKNYWLSTIGHDGLKWSALTVWLGMLGAALVSPFVQRLKAERRRLWWFCFAALAAALWISWLKARNAHACPWDIDVFGGVKAWFPLFGSPPIEQAGRCWPGGHAAGGFSLLSGYFAWRDSNRSLARSWLMVSLTLGTLMSATQIARGAHFLSHNLWTLWWCWLVCLGFYVMRCAMWRQGPIPLDQAE